MSNEDIQKNAKFTRKLAEYWSLRYTERLHQSEGRSELYVLYRDWADKVEKELSDAVQR